MKKTLIFLILLSTIACAQLTRIPFTRNQDDYMKTVFVDKTTSQTITGQKNFSVLKVGADTVDVGKRISGTINVKEFDAVGDSVTDDRDAFNQALAYLSSNGGGTLIVPEGNYFILREINVPSNVTIRGSGYNSVICYPDTGWTLSGFDRYGMLNLNGSDNVRITGLRLSGSLNTTNLTTPKFIFFQNSHNIMIDNCYFENKIYEGIWEYYYNTDITLTNNYFYNVGRGGFYNGDYTYGLPAMQMTADGCVISNNIFVDCGGGIGYSGSRATITGNYIRNIQSKGISTGDAQQDGLITITGNVVETTVDSLSTGCYYFGGGVYGYTQHSLNVTGNIARLFGETWFGAICYQVANFTTDIMMSNNIAEIDSMGTGFKISALQDIDVVLNSNRVVINKNSGQNVGFQVISNDSGSTIRVISNGNTFKGFDSDDFAQYYSFSESGIYDVTITADIKDGGSFFINGSQINYTSSQYNNIPLYFNQNSSVMQLFGTVSADTVTASIVNINGLPISTSGLVSGQLYSDIRSGSVQIAMPENLVVNGDFADWTGSGKSATPTGWTFAPDPRDTTKIYIEQSPTGKLHFVWDGSQTGASHYVIQPTSSIGVTYGYSFVVETITDTALVYIVGNGITVASTGTYSGSYESIANEKFKIFPKYGAGEITLDNFKLWVVGGNIDAPTYDVPVILDSLGVLISGVGSTSTGNPDSLGGQPASAYLLKSDSTIYLTPSDANSAYASKSHTHTEFYDTLAISFGIMDTVTIGDYAGRKIENNIIITEVSAYTNTGTVTFNIEERGETTPNTAGTDVMTSDLVADDNQQETTTFSNSGIARDSWLVLNVTSKTGDPTIFGVTIRYVKTN